MTKFNNNSGYALPFLLVTYLLVTSMLVITINFFYIFDKYEIRKYHKKKLDLACRSAVEQFISSKIFDWSKDKIINVDSTDVILQCQRKGIYYSITSLAKNKRDSSSVTFLLGEPVSTPFDNAVIISRPSLNAAVTGHTKIVGDILCTASNLSKRIIMGIDKSSSEYLTGKINTDNDIRPKLFSDSLVSSLFTQHGFIPIRECMEIPEGVPLDSLLISSNDSVSNYYAAGNLALAGNLWRIKNKTIKVFVSAETMIQNGTKSNADIEIFCDSTFTIGSGAQIENMIITAGSYIKICPGAVCKNVQLFSKKGIQCDNAFFKFPSVLCLYVDPIDTSKQKCRINIKESRINGSIMLISTEVGTEVNKSRIIIDEKSRIQGLVYSENNCENHSEVAGAVYTYNFYYYKKPTEYINWLVDLRINRKKLDELFLLPLGFYENHNLEIIKETWNY